MEGLNWIHLTIVALALHNVNSATGQAINHACVMTGNTLDCTRKDLITLPFVELPENITSMDFSHNQIERIENGSFVNMDHVTVINLSHNKISSMESQCFLGLNNLNVLDISHNLLSTPSSFIPGIFKPLQKLEILFMQGTVQSSAYPDEALKDLINLKELYMQGQSRQPFGSGFTQLTQLEILHLSPPTCNVGELRNDTLQNLRFSPIKMLVFQQCSISIIDNGALLHLPTLKTLNVVCNFALGIRNILRAISNIPGNPVESLVLDDVDRGVGDFRKFRKETFCRFANFPNLKKLSIRNNAIDEISLDFLDCIPSLEVLNLGFNALAVTWAPWHIFNSNTRQYWENSKITELDMSYGYTSFQPTFRTMYCPQYMKTTKQYFRNAQIPDEIPGIIPSPRVPSILDKYLKLDFNPSLQALHFDHMQFSFSGEHTDLAFATGFLSSSLCQLSFPVNDLRFINASYNAFGDFNCHITGLDHVQVFDLSHSNLKTIYPATTKSVPNLKVLFLTGNELFSAKDQWEKALNFVPRLEFISISDNKLKHFPVNPFSKNKNLRNIDLSKNSLSQITTNIRGLHHLETLDLSHNLISSLDNSFLEQLLDRSSNKTLTIDLRENPFQCNCNAIDFLEFLKKSLDQKVAFKHVDEYYCLFNGETTRLLEVDILLLTDSCKEFNFYTIIIAVLVVLICVVIIVALVTYRYRWKIAWKVYELRRVARQAKRRKSFKLPVHKYKLFVAYATLDDVGLPWMRYELLPRVEQEWGMKAFILDRDSLVGPFLEEVTNGIKHSEKKLFTVTPDFIRLYHWPMVLHWCVDSGLSTLIVVLIDMQIGDLPPSLAKVAMSLEKCYPTHILYYKTNGDNREVWSHLKVALDEPKRKSTRVSVI